MLGLMMKTPLLLSSILTHAAHVHATSRSCPEHRTVGITAPLSRGSASAALSWHALSGSACSRAIGWRRSRGMAIAIWSFTTAFRGLGAVCHTVNPRLFVEQIVYIINHAEDRFIFFDASFVGLVKELMPKCPSSSLDPARRRNRRRPPRSQTCSDYEDLLAAGRRVRLADVRREYRLGLCYTSGTTGNPKGVLYSHRSGVLHSFAAALPDACNVSLTIRSRSFRRCSTRCPGACPIALRRWDQSS